MKPRWILLPLLGALWASAPGLSAPVQGSGGESSEVHAGPQTQSVQPAPLAGLWSLSLDADLSWEAGEDLLSFYPRGALPAPGTRAFPGFSLGLRRHLSDSFFVSLQFASLPKGYNLTLGQDNDAWTFDSLLLGASAGWMLYRAVSVALYGEAQVGWLLLADGGLERGGPNALSGSVEGSGLAEQFDLGALWFILPSVALEAQGGYRFARLPLSFSTGAGPQRPPWAPEFYADFSGSFARLGLSFFWGLKNPWGEQEAPQAPPPPPAAGNAP